MRRKERSRINIRFLTFETNGWFPLADNETWEEECVQGQERVGEDWKKSKTMSRS